MQNKNETDNDKILISKILDKYNFCKIKNKITYSDFLNQREKHIINKNISLENYFFDGGVKNAEREILFFYPEKINEDIARKSINENICVIRIILPNDNIGKYAHRDYLSALMKIGITREKVGDIIVYEQGADIIVFKMNSEFIKSSLEQLTRFKKSRIEIIDINKVREKDEKFILSSIIVSSMRVDNIVAELANCSRSYANKLIDEERIYVNYELILK